MKLLNLNLYTFLVTILSLTLISCSDDDDSVAQTPPGDDTFEIIAQSENHNTLETLLEDTGLDQVLNNDVFTVFAPTDAAFDNEDLSGLTNDQKKNLLLNHVIKGEIFYQAPPASTQTTLSTGYFNTQATVKFNDVENNLDVYINLGDNVVVNGSSTVIESDKNANNGVVHVVDKVVPMPKITTFASSDESLGNLRTALTRNDLQTNFVDILSTETGTSPAPLTVFAPRDDLSDPDDQDIIFENLYNELNLNNLNDISEVTLTGSLNTHIIEDENFIFRDLSEEDEVEPVDRQTIGDILEIDEENQKITDPNGREISIKTTNVQATNGVIHTIDKVVLPKLTPLESTFDKIADSPEHNTLEQALIDTDLKDVLDSGFFTVFAPTDASIGNALDGLSIDVKTNILLNHVLNGNILSSELNSGYFKTLATEKITGKENPLDLYVNTDGIVTLNDDANVTSADLKTDLGTVHVVDAVIPMPDVTTFAVADPTFSSLEDALTRNDLQTDFVDILSEDNGSGLTPFTVFAPTDDAFSDLLNEQGFNDLSDVPQALLENTLNSHVVAENNIRAAELPVGPVSTLGAELTANPGDATLTDPNGNVSNIDEEVTDVQTTNGVIHAIDKVLLP